MKSAKIENGKIKLGDFIYDKIIFPHAAIIPEDMLELFSAAGENILFGYQPPQFTVSGKVVSIPGAGYFKNNTELAQLLDMFPWLRPVQVPDNTWCSVSENNDEMIVSVAPSRWGTQLRKTLFFVGLFFQKNPRRN